MATSRRQVLKTLGLGVGSAVIGTGTAAARKGFPPEKHTTWGTEGSFDGGTVTVRPFETTNPAGKPVFAGVYLTGDIGELPSGAGDSPEELHLEFSEQTVFQFAGIDWNPQGHEPAGVYDVPHFDFHFNLLSKATVEDISGGPVSYDLPADQMPPHYFRTFEAVPEMGEHLIDATAPEITGGSSAFTKTLIWGASDSDDDGCGELLFVEPMVTRAYLSGLGGEVRTPITMPDAFPDAGWYPTEYVIRSLGNGKGYVVTVESFEPFPASVGCTD